jgi:hypothetical protein
MMGQAAGPVRVERPEPLAHPGRTALQLPLLDRLGLAQPTLITHTAIIPLSDVRPG